ncbi:MAG: cupin domain-containing protein [Acidimicrobiia bacterium]
MFSDEWDRTQDHPGFGWTAMRLGARLGGEMIGASVYLLEPDQKSFPYHFHHANEELLLVLEGTVMVRTPDGEVEAGPGNAILFERGPSGAHQVINRSEVPARYIMFSTLVEPEIAEYPDSGNIGVFAGFAQRAERQKPLRKILDGSAEADYFEGA